MNTKEFQALPVGTKIKCWYSQQTYEITENNNGEIKAAQTITVKPVSENTPSEHYAFDVIDENQM